MVYQIFKNYIKRDTLIAETDSRELAKEIMTNARAHQKENAKHYCGQVHFRIVTSRTPQLISQ